MFKYLCTLLNNMGKYKISDLENLSGIKAHTIRIWEQRYNILEPLRTETNIRYYDDEQLKKLLNVVTLINAGNKISMISKLSSNEILERIESIASIGGPGIKEESLINQLISSGLTYNELLFEKAFSNSILSFGVTGAYEKVLYPMLNKLGLLWLTEEMNPSQEHFVSNMIRQKLFAAIDSLNPADESDETWMLFLPEGELHELGLLVANYILRSKGKNVCYLGADVPLHNLVDAVKEVKPSHLLLFNVRQNREEDMQLWLNEMHQQLKYKILYKCCSKESAQILQVNKKQKLITDFHEFMEIAQ